MCPWCGHQTLFAAARVMAEYLGAPRDAGEPAGLDGRLMSFAVFNALIGARRSGSESGGSDDRDPGE